MLRLFEVTGFKNFKNTITLDFSDVRDYKYNSECITDGLIGKMIIYGKNAIGKSNFGLALFDILSPNDDRRNWLIKEVDYLSDPYLNMRNTKGYAEFRYVFQFEEKQVEYIYRKDSLRTLIYEKVIIDDALLFEYDNEYPEGCNTEGLKKLSPSLILDFENVESVFSYVIANTPLESGHPLRKTVEYIKKMRIIKSSFKSSGRERRGVLPIFLSGSDVREDFEGFLNEFGIYEELTTIKDKDGWERLYYNTTPPVPFSHMASSGTQVLLDLYGAYKLADRDRTSLLFLDEFDSFYHYELAERVIQKLEGLKNTQVIFTSHNTNLLSNRIMRPDCYFILTEDNLTSFANATNRELREGHNLEKLYISGEFGE